MAELQQAKLKRQAELAQRDLVEDPTASTTTGPDLERTANPLSRLFFSWLDALVVAGNKRPLNSTDFAQLPTERTAQWLADRMTAEWNLERAKPKPSLRMVLVRVLWRPYLANLVIGLAASVFKIGQAEILRFVVASFSDPNATNTSIYLLAMGFTLASFFGSLCAQHFMIGNIRSGVQARVGFIAAVYSKLTRLATSSISSTGQVINIISNDVQRLEDAGTFSAFLVTSVFECIVCLGLVWSTIGPVALIGFGTLFLFMVPLQSYFARKFGEIRKKTVGIRDERVRNLNDSFMGMQVLKLYAWEEPFADRIMEVRRRETENLRKASYLKSINDGFFASSPSLMSMTTFLPFVALGNQLFAAGVFSTIALYNIVRLSTTNFIPKAIEALSESRISLQRLQTFMTLDEIDPAANGVFRDRRPKQGEEAVAFSKATFKWPVVLKTKKPPAPPLTSRRSGSFSNLLRRNTASNLNQALDAKPIPVELAEDTAAEEAVNKQRLERPTLSDLTFSVKMGELVAVVGAVGSGKSSLAMALLGEIPRKDGSIVVNGRVAFVAQSAWILAGTARENILFGQPLEKARYDRVVASCALDRDFATFPNGDLTPIGERGVTLSGGQRARLSLARAIYFNAEIYVLDDPLSAVDTRVARILFDDAIRTMLKDKAVLLITHQLQFARTADRLFVLDEGSLVAQGDYDTVAAVESPYAKVLRSYQTTDNASVDEMAVSVSTTLSMEVAGKDTAEQSAKSKKGEKGDKAAAASKIGIQTEERATGNLGAKAYWRYFGHGGGIFGGFVLFPLLFIMAMPVASSTASDWFLSYWTRNPGSDIMLFSAIYGGLVAFALVTALVRGFFFYSVCLNASRSIFHEMLDSVMRTPAQFFIENPVGRVLNRFAKDQGLVDENLPMTILDFTFCSSVILSIFGVVGSVAPWVLIALLPLLVLFYFLRRYFLVASREIKRLEATTRSPVYAHVSTTLDGLATIRAFNLEHRFVEMFCSFQDQNTSIYLTFMTVSRWLGLRLDMMTVVFLTLTVFIGSALRTELSPGAMGLALSYVMQLAGLFQWATRQSTEVENLMTSVERMLQYTSLPSEAPRITDVRPTADWPSTGKLVFEHMSMTYPGTATPVLDDLSFSINSGEKVGIVGRTGAGKSSLTLSLFRIVEPTIKGSIKIDGVDCSALGLKDLRSRLAIIPQEPFLFKGTVRFNLDPNSERSDQELWSAINAVELKQVVERLDGKLEANVTENGANFSAGERQLFCLARAILRNSRVIVMDECTANVDAGTDKLIQESVRKQFADSTVLTIAHRLLTIIDYDRVMVLDAGKLVEFDAPHLLLQRPSSYFAQLVDQTGPEMSAHLRRLAAGAYEKYVVARASSASSDVHVV